MKHLFVAITLFICSTPYLVAENETRHTRTNEATPATVADDYDNIAMTEASRDAYHTLSLVFDGRFYLDNTEYRSLLRKGRTYVGNLFDCYLSVASTRVSLAAGLFFNHAYGDDTYPTELFPFIRLTLTPRAWFRLDFGNINSRDRHGMPDAILMEQRDYTAANQCGMKLTFTNRLFTYVTWANMNLLVTTNHREYLDYGNNVTLTLLGVNVFLQTYISHHGGQTHQSGPVADNVVGAAGVAYGYTFGPVRVSAKARVFGDVDTPDRSDLSLASRGRGVLAEAAVTLFDALSLGAAVWKGTNFITEEGNPLYRVDEPYLSLCARFRYPVFETTDVFLEYRGHFLESRYDYTWRFEVFHRFSVELAVFEVASLSR